MTAPRLRIGLCAALLMAITATAAWWLKPTRALADTLTPVVLEDMVPAEFGEWRLVTRNSVLAVDPTVEENLERTYEQVLSRTYSNAAGDEVMLNIAYGREQTHELKAHRQEVCYTSQGFTIQNLSAATLDLRQHPIPVTQMYAVRAERTEPVTYWFTMGDQVVYSIPERLLTGLSYGARGLVPDGFLVRVSNISAEPQRAYRLHQQFVTALEANLAPEVRSRLLGTAASESTNAALGARSSALLSLKKS